MEVEEGRVTGHEQRIEHLERLRLEHEAVRGLFGHGYDLLGLHRGSGEEKQNKRESSDLHRFHSKVVLTYARFVRVICGGFSVAIRSGAGGSAGGALQ